MTTSPFHLYLDACQDVLIQRLSDNAPSRIQLVTGPRQVGKTTMLGRIAASFGARAVYGAADSPAASNAGYWDSLWAEAERVAAAQGPAVLLLDEIHMFENWATRLKGSWDRVVRLNLPVHVVASGSSALRLGHGAKESLAGRFERLTVAHWPAHMLASHLGVPLEHAAQTAVTRGTYPGAIPLRDDFARWQAYVRDAIAEPAIGKDIAAMELVRRPALLRQLFALCANMPAQIVALRKLQGEMQDPGVLPTLSHYLTLLEEAYLVAPLEKFSRVAIRRRAAPPKLLVLNNALLGAMDPRGVPDAATDPARFGAWVANACLAHAWNAGQRVTYWRAEPVEVDGVFEGSWGNWAVEIKTGGFETTSLRGLTTFCQRYPEFQPLVIRGEKGAEIADRAGIRSMTWMEFLMTGIVGAGG